MSCEMTKDGMQMKLSPMEPSQLEAMKGRMEMMSSMMQAGMPCMITCNGMPMMMGMA
jgi:hypothetical protein